MSIERSTERAGIQQHVPDKDAVKASFIVGQRRNGKTSGLQTTQASVAGALPLSPELQVLGALAGAVGKFLAPGGGSAAAAGAVASGGSAAGGGAAAFGATLMKGGIVTVVGAGLVMGEAFIPGIGLSAGSSRSERMAQSGTLLSRIVKESPDLEIGTDPKTGQRAAVDKVTGKTAYVINKDGSLQIADGMKAIAADRALATFVDQTIKTMKKQGLDVSNSADLKQAVRDYATTKVGSSASPKEYAAVFAKLAGDKEALKTLSERAQATAPLAPNPGGAVGGSDGAAQKQPLPTYEDYANRILGEVNATSPAASTNVMEQNLEGLGAYDRENGTTLTRRVKKAAKEKVQSRVEDLKYAGRKVPTAEEQKEMERQEAEGLAGKVLEELENAKRGKKIAPGGDATGQTLTRSEVRNIASDVISDYEASSGLINPPPKGKPPKLRISKTQIATVATVAGAPVLLGAAYLGIREAVEHFGRKEGISGSEPWTYPENADGSYFDEKRNPEFKETDHNVGSRGLFGVRIKETKEGEGADGLGDVVQIVAPLAKRPGVERKQLVDLGERVKPGQPVLRVKDDDLEAEITKLETELKSLEGRIGVEIFRASKAKNIPRQEVQAIDAQIQEKEVDLARATVDLKRVNTLYKEGAVPKQAQDEAVALVERTKAQISDLNADRRAALTTLELAGSAANLSPTKAIEIMKTGTAEKRANLPESVAEAVGNYLATLNELSKQLDLQARNTTYSSVYGTVTNSSALDTYANNLDSTLTLTDNSPDGLGGTGEDKNALVTNKNDNDFAILIDKSPDGPYGPGKGDALTVETIVSWDVFSTIKKGDVLPYVLTDGSTGTGTVDRLVTTGEGDGYRVELKIDGKLTAPDGTEKKLDPKYADYIRVYAKTDPTTVRPKPINNIEGDDLVNEISFSEASLPTEANSPTAFPQRRQDFEFSRPVYQKHGDNRTLVGTVIVKGTVTTDGKTVKLEDNTTVSFRSVDGNTAATDDIKKPQTFGGSSYGGVKGIDGSMVKASVKLNVTADNAARAFNATFGETRLPDSTETTFRFTIVSSGANDEIVRFRLPDAILMPDM